MAKFTLIFLLLSLLSMATPTPTPTPTPTSFIKSSCSTTPYPTLCLESLSVYETKIQQDPHKLVLIALSLSLNKTQSTKGFVTMYNTFKNLKPREYAAIQDCVEEINDSVDRLSRSLNELKLCKINGQDFNWHISNIETWVSSALTDESTCQDEFDGKALDGRIKASIVSRMVNIAQFTSNALSLINQYATNHMEEVKH